MPAINPEVTQWIRQMGDNDQVIAYFAYQSLLEQVLHTSTPGRTAEQETLATALGEALTARSNQRQAGSFGDNPFLAAVASQTASYQHPPRVRSNLARLLGHLPIEAVVPYLTKALEDLEAREMARFSLDANPSAAATDALIGALDSAGGTFVAGVVNSLAQKKGGKAAAAIRKASEERQPEVRIAALYALADVPAPVHDAILEAATRSPSAEERRVAHIARVRLAESLRASGERQAADRICKSVLQSSADEPQKRAARIALGA